MNWHIVEGGWKQFKGKARKLWGGLVNNRLDVIGGRRTELAGKAQRAYGETKDKAEHQLTRFLRQHNKDYRPKRSA